MAPTLADFEGIHHYDERLVTARQRVKNAPIPSRSAELILAFERTVFLQEALSKPRRIKVLELLCSLCKYFLQPPLDAATKDDLKATVQRIEEADLSAWTKYGHKIMLRKFYTWLHYGDAYVEHARRHEWSPLVSWLHVSIRKQERPVVHAGDILTEEEVERLIRAAERPRDRAFVAMIYELGARIGEMGGLRISSVTKDKYSYLVDLEGKTGHRTPRVILSAPYLPVWLEAHPLKDNPSAPLWVTTRGRRGDVAKMDYPALKKVLQRLVAKAGIKKRVYPHLFRHTRPTHLLRAGTINEAQAKVYFGWTPDSTMLANYAHLVSRDVNDALLKASGIGVEEQKPSMLTPRQCAACKGINAPRARFCQHCSAVLDLGVAVELEERREGADAFMNWLTQDPEARALLERKASEYRGLQADSGSRAIARSP